MFGASKADGNVEAKSLSEAFDAEVTYSAVQAGITAAGGSMTLQVKNSKGVILAVRRRQVGLDFSLDIRGMNISLK